MTDTPRTTFRFNDQEAAFAALLRQPTSDEAEAVRDIAGYDDLSHAPAATLLHVLVDAGIRAVQEQADHVRYARLAEFVKNDPEHQAWHQACRARRIRRSAQREGA